MSMAETIETAIETFEIVANIKADDDLSEIEKDELIDAILEVEES